MNCIKIINDLAGGGRPGWILKAWIGLVLPLQLAYRPFSRGQLNLETIEVVPFGVAFPVDVRLAIQILDLHQPEAARWWREESDVSGGEFYFNAECCELVEGVPSVTAPRISPLQMTVSEFLCAVTRAEDSAYFLNATGVAELFHEEHVATFLQSALTPAAVLLIANEVVKECAFGIEGTSTQEMMDYILASGHRSLQAAHHTAEQSGVKLPLEWVDQPLCIVDALERDGLIQVKDGLVYPVGSAQSKLDLN